MRVSKNDVIGEIAVKDYDTAKVFQNFGINFCCEGQKTIEEVCRENDIPEKQLLDPLNQQVSANKYTFNFYETWDIDLLVDYLERKHRKIEQEIVPDINKLLDQSTEDNEVDREFLVELKSFFLKASASLINHMAKEHETLFPLIKTIYFSNRGKTDIAHSYRNKLIENIHRMFREHRVEGNYLRDLHGYIVKLENSGYSSESLKKGLKLMREYFDDLQLHIHIENNLLFPKVLKLTSKEAVIHEWQNQINY